MRFHRNMRTISALSVAVGLLALADRASAAELLRNGNFDRTYQQEVTPGFSVPKPADWVNIGSRTISGPYEDELSSEPWAGPAPTPVTGPPDMGVFFKPFTGNATDGSMQAALYQENPATPGLIYTLTGWFGAEPNFSGNAAFAIDFLNATGGGIGNTGVEMNLREAGLFTPNGQPFNYKRYLISALAPAGTAGIRARVVMTGQANPAGGGQAFVVDDLSLVPEPAFLSLAVPAGLLLLRRRRQLA